MTARRPVVAALGGLLLLTGCTIGPSPDPGLIVSGAVPVPDQPTADPSTMPVGPGGPGQPAEELSWDVCPGRFEPAGGDLTTSCAILKVPVNRAEPRADVYIDLVRVTAPTVSAEATPVVAVLDEPGRFPVSDAAALAEQVSPDLIAARPVIFLDRRGSGESDPLDCLYFDTEEQLRSLPASPGPDEDDTQAFAAFSRQFAFDCGDVADPHLTRFNSVAAADDLDSLRASLGLEQLDYLGRGDGATLGVVYAERYPGRTGAMVLDAPSDPRLGAAERAVSSAVAFEALLDRYAAACVAAQCPLGADPRAAVEALVVSLDDDPGSADFPVTGGTVLDMLRLVLPDPSRWPDLDEALAEAVDGDVEALGELSVASAGGVVALSGALAISCNDTPARLLGPPLADAAAAAAEQAPLFGPALIGRLGLCGGWPAPDAVPGGLTGSGTGPVVIVSGTEDPSAPAAEVAALAGQLGSSVTVNRSSSRHGNYPDSVCVRSAVDGFLVDGTVPVDGLLCPP